MGGGLMQLVAYGAQDIYLTGNPQITFFKVVYRRHTNFSMEAIKQTWSGNATSNGQCTATISRNGDLVHRMYIEIVGNNTPTVQRANPGSHGITTIELEIGGQRVDRHSGTWMEVWAELTEPNPTGAVTDPTTLTDGTLFQNMSGMGGSDPGDTAGLRHFIPLQFWFCRNPGLALPLIALQYHEVKVILDHTYASGYATDASDVTSNDLWCDYIYLDTDERRRFAQVSHEYLTSPRTIMDKQQGRIKFQSSSQRINMGRRARSSNWFSYGPHFKLEINPQWTRSFCCSGFHLFHQNSSVGTSFGSRWFNFVRFR
jgi:hypothetical protein